MKIKNALDMELRNLLRTELQTLQEYVKMFDSMTIEEKDELREWMANGNSINSNPYLLYGENGVLMDFIDARRTNEDMMANPEQYRGIDVEGDDSGRLEDTDMPF
jgi:hypothetical protein